MIIVTGRIVTKPAHVRELLADLRDGIERSLEEDGCQFYSFAMEHEQAGSLLTLQIWRDEAALAAHLCTQEIAAFVARWDGRYQVGTKIYDATNERAVGQWQDAELGPQIQASRERWQAQ